MREKRDFAKRSADSSEREVRKKFFLVYEGEKTEAIYFGGVVDNRDRIGIDPLIELVPIVRSYSEEGWSNPKKILDRINANLVEAEYDNYSYET